MNSFVAHARPRYAKPDANQPQMAQDLRALGFCVVITHALGGDALDMFVGGLNRKTAQYAWVQVEVKSPGGALTKSEKDYIARWPDLPIIVAYDIKDVLDWFGA